MLPSWGRFLRIAFLGWDAAPRGRSTRQCFQGVTREFGEEQESSGLSDEKASIGRVWGPVLLGMRVSLAYSIEFVSFGFHLALYLVFLDEVVVQQGFNEPRGRPQETNG